MKQEAALPTNAQGSAFYDQGWQGQWNDLKRYSPVGRHTRRMILQFLRTVAFDSLIDVGCGEGSLLQEIQEAFPEKKFGGVDFSPASIEVASKKVNGSFAVCDIAKEPPHGSFDVAVCSEVLEHIPDDLQALTHISACAKTVLITVPGGPLNADSRAMGHFRHYSAESLTHLVEGAGLRVLLLRTWGFPFAYPLYDKVRGEAGTAVMTGKFGWKKKLLCHVLYVLFFGNVFNAGNKVFCLATR